jgi:precorrin-8X/cobalt-precorrin-8 methylmutase
VTRPAGGAKLAPRVGGLLARLGLPPAEIEARSLAIVERRAAAALPPDERARRVATMMLYASGDPDLATQIRIHPRAVEAGLEAIRAGRSVIADVRMVAAAIERGRLERWGCQVTCGLEQPAAEALAREWRTTRSAAGTLLLADRLDGAIAVIGNAPTALLALLDLVDEGGCRPALIIGTPVGMVGASESKEQLVRRQIPYVTVLGTRGGSALGAAAFNAISRMAVGE